MYIQYASDLHLEFRENLNMLRQKPLQALGEILILAGDIIPFARMHQHSDFFSYLSDHFQTTYWIPGNHEYYGYDLAMKCGTFNESIKSNVFLVNNTSATHGETKLIFSTLWSKISPMNEWLVEHRVSDFHLIKYNNFRLSSDVFNQQHLESLSFIKNELTNNRSFRTVLASHHVPTLMNYPEKYKGSSINEAFAVELFGLIESSSIDCWIYGHSHFNVSPFKIGKTELLTNQLGYVAAGEGMGFDFGRCLEV